jgi:lysophospholipase L1-like esterase
MRTRLLVVLVIMLTACGRGTTEMSNDVNPVNPTPAHLTDGVLRVVTVGDSLAYGAGDEAGHGIPGRLEAELRRRGAPNVETVNLGVNGAQTSDLLVRLDQQRVRASIATADAIVLSIGANDLFKTPGAREETLREPLAVAERILVRIDEIVLRLRETNPSARILILGGYNPVPNHPYAPMINQYLGLWDSILAGRFQNDPLVSVVRMSDIVVPHRLSRLDYFHPGGDAYEATAKRIASMIVTQKDAA